MISNYFAKLCLTSRSSVFRTDISRKFSLQLTRLSRNGLLSNRFRQEILRKREKMKGREPFTSPDGVKMRPASDLLKALGFTVATGAAFFYVAAFLEVDRKSRSSVNFDVKGMLNARDMMVELKKMFENDSNLMFAEEPRTLNDYFNKMSRAQQCTAALIFVNVAITLLWKWKRLEPFMYRYFTSGMSTKTLCSPMLLSVFSHKLGIHLALNMYVLWSFAPPTIRTFLDIEHFLAFYMAGGLVSSMTGLTHKCLTRNPVRALGASGAILALLGYTCMKIPHARLQVIFLPFFDFSAEHGIYGILLFDAICLMAGFRIFDHAAHLGGTLFGIFYALYGEKLYRKLANRMYLNAKSKREK